MSTKFPMYPPER